MAQWLFPEAERLPLMRTKVPPPHLFATITKLL